MEDENTLDPLRQSAACRGYPAGELPFQRQSAAMESTPNHVSPVCPMPQAAEQHGQQEVAIGLAFSVSIPAQWNVQIIAEPGAQTDVPAPPEILNAVGQVRLAEIHHKMKAHELGASPGNAAVTAEVAINLPSEGIRSQRQHGEARPAERSAK